MRSHDVAQPCRDSVGSPGCPLEVVASHLWRPSGRRPTLCTMAKRIEAGDRFPDFTLPDQDGQAASLADLLGKPFVLYFYPKDNTSGCTREACDFQAARPKFSRAKLRVIGVSPDSSASHQRFREQQGLEFTLLADPDQKLARACGVWVKKVRYGRESLGILRSTFLVGADGVIRRVWRGVRVDGHVAEVLEARHA
jgi:thioredoxin-dependent peroxiredoxin